MFPQTCRVVWVGGSKQQQKRTYPVFVITVLNVLSLNTRISCFYGTVDLIYWNDQFPYGRHCNCMTDASQDYQTQNMGPLMFPKLNRQHNKDNIRLTFVQFFFGNAQESLHYYPQEHGYCFFKLLTVLAIMGFSAKIT